MRRGGYLERGGRLPSSSAKRQAVNELLPEIRAALVKRSGGLCEVCRKAQGREAAHIIPRGSAGGPWATWNLLWLCPRCHAMDRWPYDRGRLVYDPIRLAFEGHVPVWGAVDLGIHLGGRPSHVRWCIVVAASKSAWQRGEFTIAGRGVVSLTVPA